jgi:methionyl-tRNA synthetase
VVLIHKYYEGIVPELGDLTEDEKDLVAKIAEFPNTIGASIEKFRFREALAEFMNLARLGNKYLTDTEPWKVVKTDPERVKTILHLSIQICACLSVLCEPFLPFTSAKLQQILNINVHIWNEGGKIDLLKAGDKINPPEYLFEKIEDDAIEAQVKKLKKENS